MKKLNIYSILLIIVLVSSISYLFISLTPVSSFEKNRNPCDFFGQKSFSFPEVDIIIFDEQCKNVGNQKLVFFSAEFTRTTNDTITWSLLDMQINGLNSLEYDQNPALSTLRTTTQTIDAPKVFNLYGVVNESVSKEHIQIVFPGIKKSKDS